MEDNNPSSFLFMREYFNWSYENPELVNPTITALYCFIIDHHSRLGFKEKFGLPTIMSMEAIGIKNYKTYKHAFDFLVEYGFIKVIEWSKNQYSSNVIAMVKNTKAYGKALPKASTKHMEKQVQSTAISTDQSTAISTVDIDKLNTKNINKEIDAYFESVWVNYGKVGSKLKAFEIWKKMDDERKDKIAKSIQGYHNHLQKTGYSPKHFTTYLNSDEYENYLNISTSTSGEVKVEVMKVLPTFANQYTFSLWDKIPKEKTNAERWQWYRENRPECSEVYQHCQKFQDREQEQYLLLPDKHKLKIFIIDYIKFAQHENSK